MPLAAPSGVTAAQGASMQIQLNTDNHLVGSEDLALQVDGQLRHALQRFSERITRVEVHLNDVNSGEKSGDDKRCMLEARLRGLNPMSVTHEAASIDLAVNGATDKLVRALDKVVGKLDASRRSGEATPGGDVQ
jgi:ribosome-associated translation inhibitor RaiA